MGLNQSWPTCATLVPQPILHHSKNELDLEHLLDRNCSLDSDDNSCSGCQNINHHYRQQSFSGLHSPGRSDCNIIYYLWVQTTYWSCYVKWKNFLFPSIRAFMNNLVSRVMLSNRRMFSVWLQNDTSQQNLAAEFWEVEDNSLISFIRLLILVLITFGFIAV